MRVAFQLLFPQLRTTIKAFCLPRRSPQRLPGARAAEAQASSSCRSPSFRQRISRPHRRLPVEVSAVAALGAWLRRPCSSLPQRLPRSLGLKAAKEDRRKRAGFKRCSFCGPRAPGCHSAAVQLIWEPNSGHQFGICSHKLASLMTHPKQQLLNFLETVGDTSKDLAPRPKVHQVTDAFTFPKPSELQAFHLHRLLAAHLSEVGSTFLAQLAGEIQIHSILATPRRAWHWSEPITPL